MSVTWSSAISSYNGFYSQGNRISSALDLSAISAATSSVIVWSADQPTETSIKVYAKFALDTEWLECTNGGAVPVISAGDDLSGKSLQVKIVLTSADQNKSPRITFLAVKVRQLEDPRVLFGVRYGNISQYTQRYDQRNQRTVAYVAGAGQGRYRDVSKITQTGSSRYREMYIDSRDIATWLKENADAALLGSRLSSEMSSYGDTSADLSAALGIPSATIDQWKSGSALPETAEAAVICDRYSITLDHLYGVASADYEALYTERAEQKFESYQTVDNIEFDAISKQYSYRQEYDLGDFITFVLTADESRDFQITQVDEVYEAGNIRIIPRFGTSGKTLSDVISLITERMNAIETE